MSAAGKPCEIRLPDQPMDCCISDAAPVVASGLVDGHILLHRYSPASEATQQEEGHEDQQRKGDAGPSYRAVQVLSRSSKKGASCRVVAFSSGGQHLVAGFASGSLLQLDAASGKVVVRLTKAHKAAGINRLLALQGQPNLVAAGDDTGGLRVWDLRSADAGAVYSYSQHTDFISGLTQHPSGAPGSSGSGSSGGGPRTLLAVSGDGTLSVHDLRANKALARSESDADDELLSVAVLKRGRKVVCGSQSGVLAIWSWGYWADCSDRFPGHPESVDALAAYDDDTLITGSSDGALRLISVLPNKLLAVLGCHGAEGLPVERLALAEDRRVVASASHDACVKLWDLGALRDEEDGGDEEEDGGGSSEWEEAGSSDGGGDDEAAGAAQAVGQRQQQQPQHAGPGAVTDTDGQAAPGGSGRGRGAAAAAAAAAGGGGGGDGSAGGSSDSDSDSEQGGSRKRKKRREKTAMRKGGNKGAKGGNFFADLL